MAKANDKIHQVCIIEAALGTSRVCGRDAQVVRGTLKPDQFGAIVIPPYQRIAMTDGAKHASLTDALAPDGIGIPDDLLFCVRSTRFRSVGAGEIIIPTNALYLLDGHQRFTGAETRLERGLQCLPLGAKIILGTTAKEEITLFYQVNRLQTKVSSDVLLRNSESSAAIEALRKLAQNHPGFPGVSFDQWRRPGEKIKAHMLYETAAVLHGQPKGKPIEDILDALERTTNSIGTALLVYNVKVFFDALRSCFGDGDKERFMYRADMLRALASLFCAHQDFWDAKNSQKLKVSITDIRKLGTIKMRDVERELENTSAANTLYRAFVRHMELGRRTGLTKRDHGQG